MSFYAVFGKAVYWILSCFYSVYCLCILPFLVTTILIQCECADFPKITLGKCPGLVPYRSSQSHTSGGRGTVRVGNVAQYSHGAAHRGNKCEELRGCLFNFIEQCSRPLAWQLKTGERAQGRFIVVRTDHHFSCTDNYWSLTQPIWVLKGFLLLIKVLFWE